MVIAVAPVSVSAAPPGGDRDFNNDGFDDLAIGVHRESIGASEHCGAINVLYGTADFLAADNDEFLHQDRLGLSETNESGDRFGAAMAIGDFNGDGRSDLAIASPDEHIGGAVDTGIVHVLYGFAHGLRLTDVQEFSQATEGVTSEPRDDEGFGKALAAADFNNDGFDDLAIGVPSQDVDTFDEAGAVHILYGSSDGLSASDEQFWHRNSAGILGEAEDQDEFGHTLEVGDFNGDGFFDLAITALLAQVHGVDFAGAVHVLYGSSDGLTADGDQLWSQRSPGVAESPEFLDLFGLALASGDFNDDGFDDLAIGVPGETVGAIQSAGAVHILYGTEGGLSAEGADFLHQDRNGVPETAESSDRFGDALVAGNLNGDRFDDLAIGVPGEDSAAGAVHVLFGAANRLKRNGSLFINEDSQGLESVPSPNDVFGEVLAAGDFNGDGFDDLVITTLREDVSGQDEAGAVHVLYGSPSGPLPVLSQFLHQDLPGVKDRAEPSDNFGLGLAR